MKTIATAAAVAAFCLSATMAEAATYQKIITSMPCDGTANACFTTLQVPAGKTLTLQTISCIINHNAGPTGGGIGVVGVPGGFSQYFSYPGNAGKNAIIPVTPVPITLTGGTTFLVYYKPDAGIAPIQGQTCNLRGTIN